MQQIHAHIGFVLQVGDLPAIPPFVLNQGTIVSIAQGTSIGAVSTYFNLSTAARTAYETRPASISYYPCIKY
jgi:hypothetical protein